jgi:hypothetical protein
MTPGAQFLPIIARPSSPPCHCEEERSDDEAISYGKGKRPHNYLFVRYQESVNLLFTETHIFVYVMVKTNQVCLCGRHICKKIIGEYNLS